MRSFDKEMDKYDENYLSFNIKSKALTIGWFEAFEESFKFDGEVKNKSELKRLLTQLGIG